MTEKPLLTTQDIAELLEMHITTIRRYIREGKIKAIRIGREYRIRREDFEEFLEARRK
jgi:excisionase family DNA binding protein